MLDTKRITGQHLTPYLRNIDVRWGRINLEGLPLMDFDGEDRRKYELLPGDVLVCEGGEVGRAAVWEGTVQGVCYQKALHRLRRRSSDDEPRFLYYVLWAAAMAGTFERAANQSTISHLPAERLRAYRLPFPPPTEQRWIAIYLDGECSRLKSMLDEQERVALLLDEERQGIVHALVARGLCPDTALKPSGVAWLGSVPIHWGVARIKTVAKLESGHTPSRQHPEYWLDCSIPWFTLADVWQLRDGRQEYLGETAECISELGMANSSARLLPAGTVVLSRTASVGFAGIMQRPMATSQDFANWIPRERVIPEYLLYVLRAMRPEFERLMFGSTHKTIYMPDIAEFRMPLPPVPEQRAIVAAIRGQLARTDAASAEVSGVATLLREYRSGLISAAVTGQLRHGKEV